MKLRLTRLRHASMLVAAFLCNLASHAAPVVTGWTPIFKGIDYLTGTNSTSGGDFSNLQAARAFRVDLTDPDVRLHPSPQIANYQEGARETAGMTVSRFLQTEKLQIAVNGGFFDPTEYYLPEGTPMYVSGLQISEGLVVSKPVSSYAASIVFDASNVGRVIHTNWPAQSTVGIHTAISGDYPILVNGVNIGRQYLGSGGFVHQTNPRTAIGLSQDKRHLFLLTIDGRQPGYSNGALDYETGAWFLLCGAWDAINLDGGGSATMVMEDSTGKPKRLNRPSAVADSGKERTVGSHFGVFAKPLVGFINSIEVKPSDTSATVVWQTTSPASGRIDYGVTTDLGTATATVQEPSTNHSIRIAGLEPGVEYFYQITSVAGGTTYQSSVQAFTTTNPLITNQVLQLTSEWRYKGTAQVAPNWAATDFDDSGWDGPGPGLLWNNTRQIDNGVAPKGTEVPVDPSTGFPFVTYYARTHFNLASKGVVSSIRFSGYLDDGAIFYLNGHEILRVRMAEPPAEINGSTLAVGYPCDGDANCLDEFLVTGTDVDRLVVGDNVLAVEVHNYNARSSDMTLGFDVFVNERIVTPAVLSATQADGKLTLSWDQDGFILEQAPAPQGPWTETPGAVSASPYVIADPTAGARFYRLRK